MIAQSEALRLADVPFSLRDGLWHTQADYVLKNLHVDNNQLRAQRDALLEALKYHQEQTRPIQKSIDAIQAAEENT